MELDPDPTPTATPWEEYVAAAQSLDAVRRAAAAAAAASASTLDAARAELAQVRARLEMQRARLADEAARAGAPVPALAPSPAERDAAGGAVEGDPATLLKALRRSRHLVDTADAELTGQDRTLRGSAGGPGRAGGGAGLRNLLVYGPLALVAFGMQLVLLVVLGEASPPWWAVTVVALPVLAYALGLVAVGLVFDPGPDGRVRRTPLLGAVLCFATVPMLCVGYAVLAFLR